MDRRLRFKDRISRAVQFCLVGHDIGISRETQLEGSKYRIVGALGRLQQSCRSSSTADCGAQIGMALPDLPDGFVTGLLELRGGGLQLRAGGLQRSISQESVKNLQLERQTGAKSRRTAINRVGADTHPFLTISHVRERVYLGEI